MNGSKKDGKPDLIVSSSHQGMDNQSFCDHFHKQGKGLKAAK
jgi:hypothetical protein